MGRKIAIRIFVLLLFLAGFNYAYKWFLFDKDLKEYSPLSENVIHFPDSCQLVYFGESSNFTSSPTDKDKRSISQLASDFFPEKCFCAIQQGALHAGQYLVLLRKLQEKSNLETVVITMNMRSFGADWIHSELETALQKQMVLLKPGPPIYNRLLLSLRAYDIKSKEDRHADVIKEWSKNSLEFPNPFPYTNVTDWDKARANGSFLNEDGSWDMPRIELSCHFVKNYAFMIDENNPRIKDFDAIVKLAQKNNWNLVFNLLAENTMRAEELAEPELAWLIRRNRDYLVERYNRNGVFVVDNLEDVHDSLFIDRGWPTEHYAETGRKIIAKNLADTLSNFYAETLRMR
ncbi:MAG: hypothetical protein JXA77_17880 [Bacteroidales bacterium]|nr:hypothetical protein [Bacteroidales bacterium]MBN2820356.1 hypothetical protein [Bacteroidales bacterium]